MIIKPCFSVAHKMGLTWSLWFVALTVPVLLLVSGGHILVSLCLPIGVIIPLYVGVSGWWFMSQNDYMEFSEKGLFIKTSDTNGFFLWSQIDSIRGSHQLAYIYLSGRETGLSFPFLSANDFKRIYSRWFSEHGFKASHLPLRD